MVLLVDAELLDTPSSDSSAPAQSRRLLADLLSLPNFTVHRYADEGPPSQAPSATREGTRAQPVVFPGWAVVSRRDDWGWGVIYGEQGASTLSGVIGNAVDLAAQDHHAHAYSDLDPKEAAARRTADALATQVASQAVRADLFVTERAYVHEAAARYARETTVCNVDDALALIGLYLRAQGMSHIARNEEFNRGLFSWVATRALLPSAWRWFGATVQTGTSTGDESLLLLAGSLLQRFQRSLAARDAVLIALNQPQDNDVRDEALTAVDDVTYLLMGAFDVLARVAHRVCALSGAERRAGWQAGDWLNQLKSVAPDLADVMRPGQPGAHTLMILRLLRNTIHGQALQGLHVHSSGRPDRSLVGLNREDEAAILEAMDARGGRARWGVEDALPGRVHLDPATLVETLFTDVVPLLNELMDRTPVESLSGFTSTDTGPPDDVNGVFSERCRFSIRKQYGL